MIRIVSGTFGWTAGGPLEAITAESGPRSFPAEIEARLVSEGVAEYVFPADGAAEYVLPAQGAAIAAHVQPAAAAEDPDDLPPGVPAYTEEMTKAQLAAIMDDAGIYRTESMTKQAMLDKLNQYYRG